jgi:hypothetical protein
MEGQSIFLGVGPIPLPPRFQAEILDLPDEMKENPGKKRLDRDQILVESKPELE